MIDLREYLEIIKKERPQFFKSSFERAYSAFVKLGFHEKDKKYFIDNASDIVNQMRDRCWRDFLQEEQAFTSHMLKKLIIPRVIRNMTSEEALFWYLEAYPEHIYQLCLSNTQSRRSRAGKEFEDIIELILIGAGVPMDSQGNIGIDRFEQKGLGKLVDIVSPGVVEYELNKRNTILVSAKTTLRERWQEVPEEMGRTGAREMFLATLDDKISASVLRTLYEANIQIVTTKDIKQSRYLQNNSVLTFEQLIQISLDNYKQWERYSFTDDQILQVVDIMKRQIEKHNTHDFIVSILSERLASYTRTR